MKQKKEIPLFVRKLCNGISDEKPIIIPLRPLPGKPVNECFNIVPEHIARHGGKQKIGWYILVWRRVFVEAIFHCVWESPEGEIIDITPKVHKAKTIAFLPDSAKKYTGRQVDNVRKPIVHDENISLFIGLKEECFRYINKGDLADHYGEVEIGEDFIERYEYMMELQYRLMRKYGSDIYMVTGS